MLVWPSFVTTTAPRGPSVAITARGAALAQPLAGLGDRTPAAGGAQRNAGRLGKLDLVQHRDIDAFQQLGRMGSERRHVQHRPGAGVTRLHHQRLRRLDRRLELRDPDLVAARRWSRTMALVK